MSTVGVHLRANQPLIPWSDVKHIMLENGVLTISRQSSQTQDQLARSEIPNVGVLEVFFNEALKSQRAGESSSTSSEQ